MNRREFLLAITGGMIAFCLVSSWFFDPIGNHVFAYASVSILGLSFAIQAMIQSVLLSRLREYIAVNLDIRKPPSVARSLLWLLSKPKQRDAITDDLDALFTDNVELYGSRKARWIYRWDAFRSVFAAVVALAAGLTVIRKLFHG